MKLKWQWFLGGRIMFWVSIVLVLILISAFVFTYIIDPIAILYISEQSINNTSIEILSKDYVSSCGIKIDKSIIYRYVRYLGEDEDSEDILLGTFHEWNNTYYIDISIDLYKDEDLKSVVVHETRHMIVEYLKDQNIIDLTKYTEEIAEGKNSYYNNMFNSGIYLLKEVQDDG